MRGIKPLPEARRPVKIIPYEALDKYLERCRKNDPLLCEQTVFRFWLCYQRLFVLGLT